MRNERTTGILGCRGRRVRKEYGWSGSAWVKTNEVRYVYDGRLVIQERDENNVPRVTYTRGLDLSGTLEGAGGIGGLLARTDSSHLLSSISDLQSPHAYYHSDGNGNITCLIDTNGTVVARYSYDPYGNVLSMSGPLAEANLYRFSSKEWHVNSGLVYYLYRYYEPNLQRWINRDPIGERGGINLFAFSRNSPSNFYDRDGRCPATAPGIANIFTGLKPEQQVEASRQAAPAAVAMGIAAAVTVLAPELWILPLSSLPNAATVGEAVQLPFCLFGIGAITVGEAALCYSATHPWTVPLTLGAAGEAVEMYTGKDVMGPPDDYDALSLGIYIFTDLPGLITSPCNSNESE